MLRRLLVMVSAPCVAFFPILAQPANANPSCTSGYVCAYSETNFSGEKTEIDPASSTGWQEIPFTALSIKNASPLNIEVINPSTGYTWEVNSGGSTFLQGKFLQLEKYFNPCIWPVGEVC